MDVGSELNIPQEDWYEMFIRYGLYFGAVFQLLCLCACVMLPGSKKGDNDDPDSNSQLTQQNTLKRPYRIRKQDKKKRR